MGKSILVKDRSRRPTHRKDNDSFLHTTDINDGPEYSRINFQSVTEQSNLEDFLNTADMAGRDFTAERQNVQVISNPGVGIQLTHEELVMIEEVQDEHRQLLQIPRRPAWDSTTTKEQLILSERESFTDWRRKLKILEDTEHIQMTPYEKNLDFWRQLWRVIERSDVIVQIVDARNPLLFRSQDLDTYVQEVDPSKTCMLLINKADYLTDSQREEWVKYFNKEEIRVVFFSAKEEKEKMEEETELETVIEEDSFYDKEEESEEDEEEEEEDEEEKEEDEGDDEGSWETMSDENDDISEKRRKQQISESLSKDFQNKTSISDPLAAEAAPPSTPRPAPSATDNCPDIITAEGLLDIYRSLAPALSDTKKVQTIGMVGYPNVGKSSTINVILDAKKLGVSATPGRTKHLQTLNVDPHLVLCDCPGLVFPSFVATKAHLVINGILPIDELRDHVPPVSLVCGYLPRDVLEATYSIMIPRPSADDEPDRLPTAEEFLTAHGAMRGFMTARGTPDCPRAARYVLKDFVKGKLLYCQPPPGVQGDDFQDKERHQRIVDDQPARKMPPPQLKSVVDLSFFAKKEIKASTKGNTGVTDFVRVDSMKQKIREKSLDETELGSMAGSVAGSMSSLNSTKGTGKSWKKHNNSNKKEKLRRLHRDLDVYT